MKKYSSFSIVREWGSGMLCWGGLILKLKKYCHLRPQIKSLWYERFETNKAGWEEEGREGERGAGVDHEKSSAISCSF